MLNQDKSEELLVGTQYQRQAVAVVGAVSVAGVDLPLSSELKSLGIIIDEQGRRGWRDIFVSVTRVQKGKTI